MSAGPKLLLHSHFFQQTCCKNDLLCPILSRFLRKVGKAGHSTETAAPRVARRKLWSV